MDATNKQTKTVAVAGGNTSLNSFGHAVTAGMFAPDKSRQPVEIANPSGRHELTA